jgi:hypothetical protein
MRNVRCFACYLYRLASLFFPLGLSQKHVIDILHNEREAILNTGRMPHT